MTRCAPLGFAIPRRGGVLALLAISVACSQGTKGTPALTAAEKQACAGEAESFCNLVSNCSRNAAIERDYGDLATCTARRQTLCQNRVLSPGSSLTASALDSCSIAEVGASCSTLELEFPGSACAAVAGTLGAGAACAFSDQCATGFCALPRVGAVCGQCAKPAAVGSSCSDAGCGPGLACGAFEQRCLKPGTGNCSDPNACLPGENCVGLVNDGGLANCLPSATTVNQGCDYRLQIASGCDPNLGLLCLRQLCEQTMYVDAGSTCGHPDGGASLCPTGATTCLVSGPVACAGGGVCSKGPLDARCLPPAPDGQVCDTALGPLCQPPAQCVITQGTYGVCRFPGAASCP